MKRIYSSPETTVVSVALHNLLTGTNNKELTDKQNSPSFSISLTEDEYEGEAASRRGGWFDED